MAHAPRPQPTNQPTTANCNKPKRVPPMGSLLQASCRLKEATVALEAPVEGTQLAFRPPGDRPHLASTEIERIPQRDPNQNKQKQEKPFKITQGLENGRTSIAHRFHQDWEVHRDKDRLSLQFFLRSFSRNQRDVDRGIFPVPFG